MSKNQHQYMAHSGVLSVPLITDVAGGFDGRSHNVPSNFTCCVEVVTFKWRPAPRVRGRVSLMQLFCKREPLPSSSSSREWAACCVGKEALV